MVAVAVRRGKTSNRIRWEFSDPGSIAPKLGTLVSPTSLSMLQVGKGARWIQTGDGAAQGAHAKEEVGTAEGGMMQSECCWRDR